MNTTYTLTEGNDALNRVLLMMQYDLSKTLSENIVSEQKIPTDKDLKKYQQDKLYNNTQKFVDSTAVSLRGPDGKRMSTGTSPKMLKDLPANSMTLDEFMEGYRDVLTHPVMVGLEVVLTSSGYGVTAVVAAYTALLAYDVYKGVVDEDWDWLNIVFDVLGIVSSGVISGTLRPIMKGAQGLKLNSLGKVLTYLSKTKIWSEIKPLLKGGIDVLKSISKGIKKALSWISKKTGFKSIEYAGVSVETWVKKIVYDIEEFLESSVKKTVEFLEPGANVGIKKAVTRGLVAGTAAQGLKHLDRYLKIKIPKWTGTNNEARYTLQIIIANPWIYNKDIKYQEEDPFGGLNMYLQDTKGDFYVYDGPSKKYVKVTDPNKIQSAKNMFITKAYPKLKFDDFEIDNYNKENPIYTINGSDYKQVNDSSFKLRKIK